jgi:hypothetical protein
MVSAELAGARKFGTVSIIVTAGPAGQDRRASPNAVTDYADSTSFGENVDKVD